MTKKTLVAMAATLALALPGMAIAGNSSNEVVVDGTTGLTTRTIHPASVRHRCCNDCVLRIDFMPGTRVPQNETIFCLRCCIQSNGLIANPATTG